MRKTLAFLARIAAVSSLAALTTAAAGAADIGSGPVFAPVAGALTADMVVVQPDYDGYIYGALPYGRYDSPRLPYRSRVYVSRGPRSHSIRRVHHIRQVTRVFDPYYGGGPFYHRHYCCRYW